MDSLEEKLAGILNDPESMARVREMAQSILGPNEGSAEDAAQNTAFGGNMPDPQDMQKIISIVSHLKSSGTDPRSQLLLSLKPHLSKQRREKVDTAIKILKIIEIMPYLRESGILNI